MTAIVRIAEPLSQRVEWSRMDGVGFAFGFGFGVEVTPRLKDECTERLVIERA